MNGLDILLKNAERIQVSKQRKMRTVRIKNSIYCPDCKRHLLEDSFTKNSWMVNGHEHFCKHCIERTKNGRE